MENKTKQQIQLQQYQFTRIQQQYQKILKSYILENQPLKLTLQYCLKIYRSNYTNSQPIISSFAQFSPKDISKMILKNQLHQIESHFNKLPNQSSKIQHLLIILILVMDIKFEDVPKYLIGFMGIFRQVNRNSLQTINYQDFFNYIIGQVANLQEQQQNTEFQVNFQQRKKQDYLLHDSGIKKIIFAKQLKLYIVLDWNSQLIKIYNTDMKIISRYQPSKQKHGNRSVKINYFDFNQFGNKLGIVYTDNTFELINLINLLTKSRETFQNMYLSYEIFPTEEVLTHLQFVKMTNKWLAVSQTNKLYLYHPQKPKQSQQQLVRQIILFDQPKNQLKITDIQQIIELSLNIIIAGNEIFFFNQNLTQKKYTNYKHGSNIRTIKYNPQQHCFYILGQQKFLTVLSIQRNSQNFKFSFFPLNHNVKDFQIFSHFDTILITDCQNNLHLFDLKTMFCYQKGSYSNISKNSNRFIRILKTSKLEFLIYQSYMISMAQQKVAIQRQVQYTIDSDMNFDQKKQEIYMSINNKILNFNILTGQIIKTYTSENCHLPKFSKYLIDQNNEIIIIDSAMNIFYLEKKDKQIQQRQFISKHLDIESIKFAKYDKQLKTAYILGKQQLYEIKSNNKNLQINRQLIFQNLDQIIFANYIPQNNSLFFSTDHGVFYLLSLKDFTVERKIKLNLPKDKKMIEKTKCLSSFYLHQFHTFIFLTNSNQLFLVDLNNIENHMVLNLLQGVAYKQVDIDFKFIKMVVQQINQKSPKTSRKCQQKQIQVMLTTIDGHFMKIKLTSYLKTLRTQSDANNNQNLNKPISFKAQQTNKSKYLINVNFIQTQNYMLSNQKAEKLSEQICQFQKRHQKQIIIMKTIYLQKNVTFTISKQGEINLFSNKKNILNTRLPNLVKKHSNIQDIQKIKIKRIQKNIKQILQNILKQWQNKRTPQQMLIKMKRDKFKDNDFKKINYDEPIPIEIEKKNIQDLVNKQLQSNRTFYQTTKNISNSLNMFRTHKKMRSTSSRFQQQTQTNAHPWRQKKQFLNIFSSAPSPNKYSKKIPIDLLNLRKSLDMISKVQKLNPEQLDIKIIPQLNLYKFQDKQKQLQNKNTVQTFDNLKDNFESCYYVKPTRKLRNTNINDFDQIQKQFYKKQVNFCKRYISKKDNQSEDSFAQAKASRSFNLKRNKKTQLLDYNVVPFRSNPISAVIQLFQKHNKDVAGTKYGRQISIGKQIRELKTKSFYSRY